MTEEREDAGLDAAPEGGSDRARPDTEAAPRDEERHGERALEDEPAVSAREADEPGQESRPAAGA